MLDFGGVLPCAMQCSGRGKVQRATTQQTIEALLQASKRDVLPLSYRFVQHRTKEDKGTQGR